MDLPQYFKASIQKQNLVCYGDRILIGVSGGADSMALLHLLHHARHKLGITLLAGHIHHGLRKSADQDQQFVIKVCDSLKIPCYTKRITVKGDKEKGSLEELAREKRLKALFQIAKSHRVDSIALAHHQNDQAETVLMHILRGTGLKGLQAMLPKRELNGYTLIRPLLKFRKSEIENYLDQNKLTFRMDPTNRNNKFFRNKIRHQLIPLLTKEYNPNVVDALSNLADTAGNDYLHMQNAAKQIFPALSDQAESKNKISLRIKDLNLLSTSQCRMQVRLALEKLTGSTRKITLSHLKEIEDLLANRPVKSEVHLPNGIKIRKTKILLTFHH